MRIVYAYNYVTSMFISRYKSAESYKEEEDCANIKGQKQKNQIVDLAHYRRLSTIDHLDRLDNKHFKLQAIETEFLSIHIK